MPSRVRVYTREGCGLCREALAVIARVRSRFPCDLEEVDIGGDDDLERAYDAVKYREASAAPLVEAHTIREDGRIRVIAHVQYAPPEGADRCRAGH